MREYAKVSGLFWIGKTGKSLRGDTEAQLLALYMMTSPHSNMIGVFHCPIIYMAHETGMTLEGASKALTRLIEADFCLYDDGSEVVWVKEMAAHQIGERLSPKDKQCAGVRNQYQQIAQPHIQQGFHARYAKDYHLDPVVKATTENPSPFQAPSKPLRSQEQEQEQEVNLLMPPQVVPLTLVVDPPPDAPPLASPKKNLRGHRLPSDWKLPRPWGEWAVAECGLSAEAARLEADKFADYWHARAGRDAVKLDWLATWRNWVRNEHATPMARGSPVDARSADRKRAIAELTGVPITDLGGNHERIEREINPSPRLAYSLG
jgi:hypothetical protein